MKHNVTVLGGGLAGCEAAWQLANRGVKVTLCEMKPQKKSPAHQSDALAELVCSNSLRANRIQNAVGLLKEEMRRMNSLIIQAADHTAVPAGGALAVDRDGFSAYITRRITAHENILVQGGEVTHIPTDQNCIIATGPLTSDALAANIAELLGEGLYFFDAAAPIVTLESLDMNKVYRASRYDKGADDYLNCPMDKDEYFAFVRELVAAETVEIKDFEKNKVFEGCMPVEVMAGRGELTLAFGPLKPVGLKDPRTGKEPFAVVQLRQDNAQGTLFNLVGFQTHLKFPEQKRVFGMIPGLENAAYERYGVMHRNTFINSPGKLNQNYQLLAHPNLFFAGQMTGVEGYVESTASGLLAGISLYCALEKQPMPDFTQITAIGALGHHVAHYAGKNFQPMNISFGLMEPYHLRVKNKQERYTYIAQRALEKIDEVSCQTIGGTRNGEEQ